jgi:hypothetical protein
MRAPEEVLETALALFKSTLSEYQLEKFTVATAKDVKTDIIQIQNAREQDKSLMNLSRFASFVTAYEQFDEVCQAMEMGNHELSNFIWGPPRFILQVRRVRPVFRYVSNTIMPQKAKEMPTALDSILDSYLKFGRRVPLLGNYKSLLKDHPAMRTCLAYMYADLLDFHSHILKLFTERSESAPSHSHALAASDAKLISRQIGNVPSLSTGKTTRIHS